MQSSIFDKEDFSLLDLCKSLPIIRDDEGKISSPNQIASCYYMFRTNNKDYMKNLKQVRESQGYIYTSESTGKKISFRLIFQTIDSEFNKLVIRIHTEPLCKEIFITWNELEKLYDGFKKDEFKKWYKKTFFP